MTIPRTIVKQKKKISWTTFEKKYLSREDSYRYEWLDGIIEKTKKMNKQQLFILTNLKRHFRLLKNKIKIKGELYPEADLFFKKHHRRPDVCWLTDEEVNQLIGEDNPVPSFVIEIISSNDILNKVEHKMNDYRLAGVRTVWHIFPKYKSVHVYTGKKLENMKVHTDEMICSAVLGEKKFEMKTAAIFRLLSEKK